MTTPTPASNEAREAVNRAIAETGEVYWALEYGTPIPDANLDSIIAAATQTIRTDCAAREAAAVEAERERCAAIADKFAAEWLPTKSKWDAVRHDEATGIATAIRTPKGADNATG